MKKVLIITYYWPPSGGAGVQRWVKFSKYLSYFDFEPVVISVDPKQASYPVLDDTLNKDLKGIEVIRTRTSEPFGFYKKFLRKKNIPYAGFANETAPSFAEKISRFIRGNFFIPDARKGWNKYALKSSREVIRKYDINNLVTTSPPHSTQLIGLKLKEEFNLNWIADLRDPWTDIYYYKLMYHTALSAMLDRNYEKKVLNRADKVVVVSNSLKQLMGAKSDLVQRDKISVIPNGYDHEDFLNHKSTKNESFIITYTGTIADDYHLENFLHVISELRTKKILLRFVGVVSDKYQKLMDQLQLKEKTLLISHVPHEKAIEYMVSSNLLLLAIADVPNNEGLLSGKLFEYLAAEKKILGIGPKDGDASKIIAQCDAGKMFDYEDEKGMKDFILTAYSNWKHSVDEPVKNSYKQYSRKELTRKIAMLMVDK